MARNPRKSHGKPNEAEDRAGDPRRSRTIRFSDSEWRRPCARGFRPASSSVPRPSPPPRSVSDRPAEAAVPPGHLALIKDIYRGVYLLATLRGQELIREERKDELDGIIKDGRKTMAEALGEDSA